MNDLLELMRTRKSVRWYDGNGLKQEDLDRIRAYAEHLENPFGVPVKFVFLNAEEKGLSSPVVTGESWYVAGLEEAAPGTDAAYGFSFEKLEGVSEEVCRRNTRGRCRPSRSCRA